MTPGSIDFNFRLGGALESEKFLSLKPEERGVYVSSLSDAYLDKFNDALSDDDKNEIKSLSQSRLSEFRNKLNEPRFAPSTEEFQQVAPPLPTFNQEEDVNKRIERLDEWKTRAKEALVKNRQAEEQDIDIYLEEFTNSYIRQIVGEKNKTSFAMDMVYRAAEGLVRPIATLGEFATTGDTKSTDRFFAESFPEDPNRDKELPAMVAGGVGDAIGQVGLVLAASALTGPAGGITASTVYNTSRYMQQGFQEEWKRSGDENKAYLAAVYQIPAAALETVGDTVMAGLGKTGRGFAKAFAEAATDKEKRDILAKAIPSLSREAAKQFVTEAIPGGIGAEFASGLGMYMATGHEDYLRTPGELLESGFVEGMAGLIVGTPVSRFAQKGATAKVANDIGALTEDIGKNAENVRKMQENVFSALQDRDFDRAIQLTSNKIITDSDSIKDRLEEYDAATGKYTDEKGEATDTPQPAPDLSKDEGRRRAYNQYVGADFRKSIFSEKNPESEFSILSKKENLTDLERERLDYITKVKTEIENGTYQPGELSAKVSDIPAMDREYFGPANNMFLGSYQVDLEDGTPLEQGDSDSNFYLTGSKQQLENSLKTVRSLQAAYGEIAFVPTNDPGGKIGVVVRDPATGKMKLVNGFRIPADFKPKAGAIPVEFINTGDSVSFRIGQSPVKTATRIPVDFELVEDNLATDGSITIKKKGSDQTVRITGDVAASTKMMYDERVNKVKEKKDAIEKRKQEAAAKREELKRQKEEAKARKAEDSKKDKDKKSSDSASVPLMVTRDMRQQLLDLGYSNQDINAMKPEDANNIISSGVTKNTSTLTDKDIADQEAALDAEEKQIAEDEKEIAEDESSPVEGGPSIFDRIEQQEEKQKNRAGRINPQTDTLGQSVNRSGYYEGQKGKVVQTPDGRFAFETDSGTTFELPGNAETTLAEVGVSRNLSNNQRPNTNITPEQPLQESSTPIQQPMPQMRQNKEQVKAKLKSFIGDNGGKIDKKIDKLSPEALELLGNAIDRGFNYESMVRGDFLYLLKNNPGAMTAMGVSFVDTETDTVRNVFVKSDLAKISQRDFEQVLLHETFHGAAYRVQQLNPELWNSATQDILNDPELNKFMEKEYPGWNDLTNDNKTFETIRAINEGRYNKKVSNLFNDLLQKFLDYINDFFGTVRNKSVQMLAQNIEEYLGINYGPNSTMSTVGRDSVAIYNKVIKGHDLSFLDEDPSVTIEQIRNVAAMLKISSSGTKADVIGRIQDYQKALYPSAGGGVITENPTPALEGQPAEVDENIDTIKKQIIEGESLNILLLIKLPLSERISVIRERIRRRAEILKSSYTKTEKDVIAEPGEFEGGELTYQDNSLEGQPAEYTEEQVAANEEFANNPVEENLSPVVDATEAIDNDIESVVTEEEIAVAVQELGGTDWNSVKSEFKKQFANFVNGVGNISKALVDIFNNIIKKLRIVAIAGTIAFTPTNSQYVETISPSQIANLNPSLSESISQPSAPRLSDGMPNPQFPNIEMQGQGVSLPNIDTQDLSVSQPASRLSGNISNEPITLEANLFGADASRQVRDTANWIIRSGNNNGLPFVIADKRGGLIYLFDANGDLIKKSPALYGETIGDFSNKNAKFVDNWPNKITPAGKFYGELFSDEDYGKTVDFFHANDDSWSLAIHKTYLGTPSEQRNRRLETPDPTDNRISYGCINLPEGIMNKSLIPLFKQKGGFVYVLPETRSGSAEFTRQTGVPQDVNFAQPFNNSVPENKFMFRLAESFRNAEDTVLGLKIANDGTLPSVNVKAKISKSGVNEFEIDSLSALVDSLESDGRVNISELSQAIDNEPTVVINTLDAGKSENPKDQALHELETMGYLSPYYDQDLRQFIVYDRTGTVLKYDDLPLNVTNLIDIVVEEEEGRFGGSESSVAATGRFGVDPYSNEQLEGQEISPGHKLIWSGDLSLNVPGDKKFESQHYAVGSDVAKNQLAFVRGGIHEYQPGTKLPDGTIATETTRIMEIWEVQSDWDSKTKELFDYFQIKTANEVDYRLYATDAESVKDNGKNKLLFKQDPKKRLWRTATEANAVAKNEGWFDKFRFVNGNIFNTEKEAEDFVKENTLYSPLQKYWESLALKAAVNYARKQGASNIIISDAETAMMTEGHDDIGDNYEFADLNLDGTGGIKDGKIIENATYNSGSFKMPDGWVPRNDISTLYTLENGTLGAIGGKIAEGPDGNIYRLTTYDNKKVIADLLKKSKPKITQEPGMRAAYDQRIPNGLKKLLGSKPKKVTVGVHDKAKFRQDSDVFAYELNGDWKVNNNGNIIDFNNKEEAENFANKNRGSKVFKNADGLPKNTNTGTMFAVTPTDTPQLAFAQPFSNSPDSQDNNNISQQAPETPRFKELTRDLPAKPTAADIAKFQETHPDEYQELVKMREDVLKRAGYTVEGWHGTDAGNFNEFNTPAYFFLHEKIIDQYKDQWEGPVQKKKVFLKINKIKIASDSDYLDLTSREWFNKVADSATPLNSSSFLSSKQEAITRLVAEGFDAVFGLMRRTGVPEIIAFNPSQIKSADPLATDDAGNLITPDQWADETNNNINFAQPNTNTPQFNEGLEEIEIPGLFGIPGQITDARKEKLKQLQRIKARKIEARLMPEEREAFNALRNLNRGSMLSDESFNKYVSLYQEFADTRSNKNISAVSRTPIGEVLRMAAEFKKEADQNMFDQIQEEFADIPAGNGVTLGDRTFESFNFDLDLVRILLDEAAKLDDVMEVAGVSEKRESFLERIDELRDINSEDLPAFKAQAMARIDEVQFAQDPGMFGWKHLAKGIGLMNDAMNDLRSFYDAYIDYLMNTDLEGLTDRQVRDVYYSLMGVTYDSYMLTADNFVSADTMNILRSTNANFTSAFSSDRDRRKFIRGLSSTATQMRSLAANRESQMALQRLTARFNESIKKATQFHQDVMVQYQMEAEKSFENKAGRKMLDADRWRLGIIARALEIRDDQTPSEAAQAHKERLMHSFDQYSVSGDKTLRAASASHRSFTEALFDGVPNITAEDRANNPDIVDNANDIIRENAMRLLGKDAAPMMTYYERLRDFFDVFEPMSKFTTEFVYGKQYHRYTNYMPSMVIDYNKGIENTHDAKNVTMNMSHNDLGEININRTGMASTHDRVSKLGNGQALILNINHLFGNRGRLNFIDYFTAVPRREMHEMIGKRGSSSNKALANFLGDPRGQNGRLETFANAQMIKWKNIVTSTEYIHPTMGLVNNFAGRWAGGVLSSAYQLVAQTASNIVPYLQTAIMNPSKMGDFFKAFTILTKYKTGMMEPKQAALYERLLFDLRNRHQDVIMDTSVALNPSNIKDFFKTVPGYSAIEKIDGWREDIQFAQFKWSDMVGGMPILLTEYLHNVRKATGNNTITFDNLDHYDSASYFAALDETERFIAIGDTSRRGEFMNNRKGWVTALRHILTGFAGHRINNATNFGVEMRKVMDGNLSKEEKLRSMNYMAAIGTQSAVFTVLKTLILSYIMKGIKEILSTSDEEDELENLYNKKEWAMSKEEKEAIDIEISKRREIRKIWNKVDQKENSEYFMKISLAQDFFANISIIGNIAEFIPNIILWQTADIAEAERFKELKEFEVARLKKEEKNARYFGDFKNANRLRKEISDYESLQAIAVTSPNFNQIPFNGTYGGMLKNAEGFTRSAIDAAFGVEEMSTKDWGMFLGALGYTVGDLNKYYSALEKIEKATKEANEKYLEANKNITKRADGGPVRAGNEYIVGEDGVELLRTEDGQLVPIGLDGPEIIVPNMDGTVIPNEGIDTAAGDVWEKLGLPNYGADSLIDYSNSGFISNSLSMLNNEFLSKLTKYGSNIAKGLDKSIDFVADIMGSERAGDMGAIAEWLDAESGSFKREAKKDRILSRITEDRDSVTNVLGVAINVVPAILAKNPILNSINELMTEQDENVPNELIEEVIQLSANPTIKKAQDWVHKIKNKNNPIYKKLSKHFNVPEKVMEVLAESLEYDYDTDIMDSVNKIIQPSIIQNEANKYQKDIRREQNSAGQRN